MATFRRTLRNLLIGLVLFCSLLVNAGLGYYQFGHWQDLPEWDIKLFGYRLTSGQKLFQTQVAFSKLNQLSGQYEQLAVISKEISHQFTELQTGFLALEGTAQTTRETIAATANRLAKLETSLLAQQNVLQQKEAQLQEKAIALQEAEKVIKNQQRLLKASPNIRLDNDAYILQHEFTRLSRILAEQSDDARFIQTSLRKGIISIPVSQLFNATDPTELTPSAQNFFHTFNASMQHLPHATVEIIQSQGVTVASHDSLHSVYSSTIALSLINLGMSPQRLLVASQPEDGSAQGEPLHIQLRISI